MFTIQTHKLIIPNMFCTFKWTSQPYCMIKFYKFKWLNFEGSLVTWDILMWSLERNKLETAKSKYMSTRRDRYTYRQVFYVYTNARRIHWYQENKTSRNKSLCSNQIQLQYIKQTNKIGLSKYNENLRWLWKQFFTNFSYNVQPSAHASSI